MKFAKKRIVIVVRIVLVAGILLSGSFNSTQSAFGRSRREPVEPISASLVQATSVPDVAMDATPNALAVTPAVSPSEPTQNASATLSTSSTLTVEPIVTPDVVIPTSTPAPRMDPADVATQTVPIAPPVFQPVPTIVFPVAPPDLTAALALSNVVAPPDGPGPWPTLPAPDYPPMRPYLNADVEVTPIPTYVPEPDLMAITPTVSPDNVAYARVLTDETQLLEAGQPTQFADGRLNVSIPAEENVKAVRVQVKQVRALQKNEYQFAFVFDISAIDQQDAPKNQFGRPVTLRIQMKDLIGNGRPNILVFNEIQRWWEPFRDFTYDYKTGEAVITTAHFSTWGTANAYDLNPEDYAPKPWQFATNLGNVNVHRGSAEYAYTFDVPAIPNGLQPKVSIAYSSAAADEVMIDRPNVGYGWNAPSVPHIRRLLRRSSGDGSQIIYRNDFILTLNGQTHNLIRKSSGTAPADYKEYVPENYAPIRAYRCNEQTNWCGDGTLNVLISTLGWTYKDSVEYWKIWDPAGNLYVMGPDRQSRQHLGGKNYSMVYDDGSGEEVLNADGPTTRYTHEHYLGVTQTDSIGIVASSIGDLEYYPSVAWYVRWIYAPVGDQISLTNLAANRASVTYEYGGAPHPDHYVAEMRVDTITYGNRLNPNTGSPISAQYQVNFTYRQDLSVGQDATGIQQLNQLLTVTVVAAPTGQVMRKYDLTYSTDQPFFPDLNTGCKLLSIQPKIYGSLVALPATTFTYDLVPGTRIFHLKTVTNGYRGLTEFDYTRFYHPDPSKSQKQAYAVTAMRQGNGMATIAPAAAITRTTTYSYANADACWDDIGFGCHNPKFQWDHSLRLMGFDAMTATVNTPALTPLSWTHYRFANNYKVYGLMLEMKQSAGPGPEVLQSQSMVYTIFSNVIAPFTSTIFPNDAWFVGKVLVKTYPHGDFASTPYITTTYGYDGHGNVTHIYEGGYVGSSGDERRVVRAYHNVTTSSYSTATAWMIGKLKYENVYDALFDGTLKTQTVLYYDKPDTNYDDSNLGAYESSVPTKGLVTKVLRGRLANTGESSQQRMQYDVAGNLSIITDGLGIVTQAAYDDTGLVPITITNAKGHATRLYYYGISPGCTLTNGTGLYGQTKCVVDANNAQTGYSYDGFGRLKYIAKPGNVTVGPYDADESYYYFDGGSGDHLTAAVFHIEHHVMQSRNFLASFSRTFYDGLGQVIQTQTPDYRWTFGASNNQDITTYTLYDSQGRPIRQSVPHLILEVTGTLDRYTPPDLTITGTLTAYDAVGRPITTTGPDGQITAQGYLSDVQRPSLPAQYATTMSQHWLRDASGHAKHEVLDGLGRLVRVREFTGTSPYGVYAETKYGYDGLDNLVQVVAQHLTPQPITTTIGYDALSRKVQLNDPDMGAWSYGYDANGNLLSQLDAKGQELAFSYDALNRMTVKSQGTLTPTVYEVETGGFNGHVIGSDSGSGYWLSPAAGTPPGYLTYGPYQAAPQAGPGQVARFRLAIDVATGDNEAVAVVHVSDYTAGQQIIALRVLHRQEFTGGITNFSEFDVHFDTTGRAGHLMEYRVYWVGKAQMAHDKTTAYWQTAAQGLAYYGYDDTGVTPNALGRRTSMVTAAGDASWFRWGPWGLLEGKYDRFVITDTYQDYATWMTYDRASRLVATAYPSGDVMTTTYNNANQPVTLRNQTPRVFVTDTLYNPLGQPTQVNLGNTQSNRYYYYGLNLNAPTVFGNANYGRLRQTCVLSTSAGDCSESQRAAVTPTLLNLTYAYDAVGNVSALDDRTRSLTSTFSYDEQDRLTGWTQGGVPKESYSYNAIGNLTSKTGLGTMAYTDTAHVHALTGISAGLVATYDANGNMLQRWTPSSWFTHEWNIYNQITRTVSAVTPTLDIYYFYDADNVLVRKLIGGVHTLYVGKHWERNMTTGIMTQYYYHGGQRVAMRVGSTTTSTVTYLHGDHLGSASVETNDTTGGKVAELRYTPFGETDYQAGGLTTDKRFTGQREEIGSGLYDYSARMYSPLLGRFVSPDSIVPRPGDPQAFNRYGYARNNPTSRVDPSGHGDCNVHTTWSCYPDGYKPRPPLGRPLFSSPGWQQLPKKIETVKTVIDKTLPTNIILHAGAGTQRGTTAGGGAIEGIWNLRSGEQSVFVSPVVGQAFGRTATFEGGIGIGWNMKTNTEYRGAFKSIGIQSIVPMPGGGVLPMNAAYFESAPTNPSGGYGMQVGVTSGGTGVYASYSDSVEVWNSDDGLTPEGRNLQVYWDTRVNNALNAFFGDFANLIFGAPRPAQ